MLGALLFISEKLPEAQAWCEACNWALKDHAGTDRKLYSFASTCHAGSRCKSSSSSSWCCARSCCKQGSFPCWRMSEVCRQHRSRCVRIFDHMEQVGQVDVPDSPSATRHLALTRFHCRNRTCALASRGHLGKDCTQGSHVWKHNHADSVCEASAPQVLVVEHPLWLLFLSKSFYLSLDERTKGRPIYCK